MIMTNKLRPILKWAGGKTQLLPELLTRIPKEYNRFYEPFIGGGAMLFSLRPIDGIINDINEQLINLYNQIKLNVNEVISITNEFDKIRCTKEFYYSMRNKYNMKISNHMNDAECASIMIWINKHCFNGLYRVNNKGFFNVPYNNKSIGKSIDEDNLREISNYLNNTNIMITCLDFEEACKDAAYGDFIYFDSPYIPINNTSNFVDYSKEGFSMTDHERLASLFKRLDRNGIKLMLSNNDTRLIYDLYKGYHIQSIDVNRMINRNGEKRTSKEVIITNY